MNKNLKPLNYMFLLVGALSLSSCIVFQPSSNSDKTSENSTSSSLNSESSNSSSSSSLESSSSSSESSSSSSSSGSSSSSSSESSSSSKEEIKVERVEISMYSTNLKVGEEQGIYAEAYPYEYTSDIMFNIIGEEGIVKFTSNNAITGIKVGKTKIVAECHGVLSNELNITVIKPEGYDNIKPEEFYANYTLALSNEDAKARTAHYLMSGSINDQVQEPTISDDRPMHEGKYIHNSESYYNAAKDSYTVVKSDGTPSFTVYKDGAYITLEEVAAYTYAFGDAPKNYIKNKKYNPSKSKWGKYLRVNNNYFSGDTSSFPYEPLLPRISGEGGDLEYYEIDIGTTGTDCNPIEYPPAIYNNGIEIVRGAARICYVKSYHSGKRPINDLSDRYVFYTFNHYNDFQEYLNYEGGWGEMFGNITGGGKLSSKSDYNPTPYVEAIRMGLF